MRSQVNRTSSEDTHDQGGVNKWCERISSQGVPSLEGRGAHYHSPPSGLQSISDGLQPNSLLDGPDDRTFSTVEAAGILRSLPRNGSERRVLRAGSLNSESQRRSAERSRHPVDSVRCQKHWWLCQEDATHRAENASCSLRFGQHHLETFDHEDSDVPLPTM